ncbi:MAG: cysteine hydrolase family protein [Oscillospiraceae bacterium]
MIGLHTVLNERKCALVLIDIQNEFCHPEGTFGRKGLDLSRADGILGPVRELIGAAHEKGFPVIFIQNVEDESTDAEAWVCRPDGDENSPNEGVTRRGSWGAELYELLPEEGDIVIEKHRFSAFHNTRLDTVLRSLGVQTVVIGGLTTNVCILTSATHAVMYGYHVVLAEDACAAWFQGAHDMAMDNIRRFVGKVAKSGEIIRAWKG